MTLSKKCPNCGTEYDANQASGLCPKCLLRGAKNIDPHLAETGAPQAKAHRPNPPKPESMDGLFPELEIIDIVGHGGMGVVYKARQKNLGREVAVKLLATSLMDDPMFAERFTREARAMAMMNHPNIISIFDFGQRGDYYYLVMEYVDGLNLRQLVSTTRLDPSEAMELVPQLCDALQYAHDRGIVHRDIKPENVLVSQDGQIKIADFGLAKLIGNPAGNVTLTHTQQVMGTINYMAPEQMERPTEVDHRADIYSLGVVIYELLTGELPIGKFAPPSQKVKLDVRLDQVVMRALEKEPQLRYQQASEFKTGVQTVSNRRLLLDAESDDASIALKIGKLVFVSASTAVCIIGILGIILGSDDFGIVEGRVAKLVGFGFLALGGLMWAMFGYFHWIFQSKPQKVAEPAAPQTSAESKPPPPISVLLIRGLGLACFFGCGLLFIASSEGIGLSGIEPNQMKFAGIATAILGAFLYAVAGMVAQAKGYKDDDD